MCRLSALEIIQIAQAIFVKSALNKETKRAM